MFLEASVYDMKKRSAEERRAQYGLLVLVMRQWPRGISRELIDVWIKDAGPTAETLAALRQGQLSAEAFASIYEQEQRALRQCSVKYYTTRADEKRSGQEQTYAMSPLDYLNQLERQHGKVTLLCWEAGPPCHRYTLQRLLTASAADGKDAPRGQEKDTHD